MPKKILLVDDSTTTLMMEEMILKQRTTYDCVTAKDGLDAISRAVVESPDLVLMDVVMPRMNGFEACKRMRLEETLRQTPIILVTTRGEEEYVEAELDSTNTPDPAQELTDQAKVYAARMRLQRTIDQADALDAIREIAANLIGSEQVAVFKVDKRRSELWLYWSFGIDPNKHVLLDLRNEPTLHTVLRGQPAFREGGQNLLSTDEPVNAIVPILVDGTVAAIVVLFRLVTHKPALEPVDRQICEVLSNCAARAVTPYQQK